MDDVELKRELERAHADCFGWAMACCRRDRDAAEEGQLTATEFELKTTCRAQSAEPATGCGL
jgi:hypothetical protein